MAPPSALYSERKCTLVALLIIVTFVLFNALSFVNHLLEMRAQQSPWGRISIFVSNVLVCVNSGAFAWPRG